MYRDHTVGVVVPAYNEEGFVGDVIATMPAFVDRIYPVDDGSSDGTWAEIREYVTAPGAARPDGDTGAQASTDADHVPVTDGGGSCVVPLRHETNHGVGAAIKTGYRRALADDVDVVAVMNGDGQMDPDVLSRLLDPIVEGRADYAKGDRLHSQAAVEGMSRFRLFGNALLTATTRGATGYWHLTDSQNGYTAIAGDTLDAVAFDDCYEDYGFLNDFLAALNDCDARVVDVPHAAVYGDEQSSIDSVRFVPSVFALLGRTFCRRITSQYVVHDFHPLVLCYLLGGVGLTSSVGAVGAALGPLDGERALIGGLLALLLFLVGAVALTLGMAFDVRENAHLGVEP
ncbi:glycosyltransferase family 2 protein [Halarchaeum sp. P4]|uniref:glycosyltransferase family 2 protein n=1 Tax=Halarchaeum sp. P4 TaxID=3421639 RepID=UPI003EB8718E